MASDVLCSVRRGQYFVKWTDFGWTVPMETSSTKNKYKTFSTSTINVKLSS
jgi:hypothetical protein